MGFNTMASSSFRTAVVEGNYRAPIRISTGTKSISGRRLSCASIAMYTSCSMTIRRSLASSRDLRQAFRCSTCCEVDMKFRLRFSVRDIAEHAATYPVDDDRVAETDVAPTAKAAGALMSLHSCKLNFIPWHLKYSLITRNKPRVIISSSLIYAEFKTRASSTNKWI